MTQYNSICISGYDKLKPYGFPIHGAIDGYSRKIIWLEVTRTNNNPEVTAKYYLDSVRQHIGCPTLLRTDNGSENGVMAAMQTYLRQDDRDNLAGQKSHAYGSSPSNQRIEGWWAFLRRHRSSWWINFFKDMIDGSVLDTGSIMDMECLWFSFHRVLQDELDKIKIQWNTHRIRRSRHSHVAGVPDALFFLPERSGGIQCKHDVTDMQISYLEEQLPTDAERYEAENTVYQEYLFYLMNFHNLQYPTTADEAFSFFQALVSVAEY